MPSSANRSLPVLLIACLLVIPGGIQATSVEEARDLKYGAVLFQFYQQNYFETLVEYAWAEDNGGIGNHGTYPELLKGGVSLSYGLDEQAETIFDRVADSNLGEPVRNRARFYLGKMQYQRGDVDSAGRNLASIRGRMPGDIDNEYRYLAGLVNVQLGHLDASLAVADTLDRRSPFAPYFYFNLAIALEGLGRTDDALGSLYRVLTLSNGSPELERLADRARMALAHLYAGRGDSLQAGQHMTAIRTTGAYSNRGLLGASWVAINAGEFSQALAPLDLLSARSVALPEVQEAILLRPHVYERLGLEGRAAQGFIAADRQFRQTLQSLELARNTLAEADVLELFVRNLDSVLDDSDWFGRAPAVAVNRLSPFLVNLMSDHTFQSVLKDLRDLYAIRNNLERWQQRQSDFDTILSARSGREQGVDHSQRLHHLNDSLQRARSRHTEMSVRLSALPAEHREPLTWRLEELQFEIERGQTALDALKGSRALADTRSFQHSVSAAMAQVDDRMVQTRSMIARLEDVMRTLVSTELDIHQQRLAQYQVEAQLAKVRILDRSLQYLDPDEDPLANARAPDKPANVVRTAQEARDETI